jgi:choline kinase
VLVPVKNGRPIDFRKLWSGEADFVSESIGFFKIDPEDFPILVDETDKRSRGSNCADSYDDVLRAMVLAGRFGYEDVTGLPWIEIDFPEDVVHARKGVVPAMTNRV